ncbi:hypothetical protein UPYG_G00350030 [Umbra pygmaea]|uniref:TERF1-interacting nuclear factor 2 N-terminal domain-containing protein n=1 Tax=Umbra pygmaea TaxID=75934 RepID=A0ABD0VYC9_UMBPY
MQCHNTCENGPPLLLPCLRLFIPPLRLVSAAMWQVVQQGHVQDYGILEEFVTTVTEILPDLLNCSQRAQLILWLRARSSDAWMEMSESKFVELVEALLKDPGEREHFYKDVFPVEFGPKYDTAIQMLMLEFLSRLDKLLLIPDLEQTASLLNAVPSALRQCLQTVPDPGQLKILLQHHRKCRHLECVESPSSTGDCVLSTLYLHQHVREMVPMEADPDTKSEYFDAVGKNGIILTADQNGRDISTEGGQPFDGETISVKMKM